MKQLSAWSLTVARAALYGCALTVPYAAAQAGDALPTGGAFAAGAGNIAQSTNALTVNQSTQRAIINWNSFSIGQGNSVQINNGAGATLNRVTGDSLSTISGALKSTGSNYLINQNGIIVTPTGKIVSGGSFVGSTRDISDSNFMAGGVLTLTGTSAGSIVNQGVIKAANGDAVLVGKSVSNSGKLLAPKGTAAMAAGDDVVLQPSNSGLQIQVQNGSGDVTNTGTVKAAQVQLDAAGGNVYALAGNNGGVVRATGTAKINGHVWLTAGGDAQVDGKVSAQNEDGAGGDIQVKATNIDVSGILDASALSAKGSGGNITVKASNNAKVTGSFKVHAGAQGGDGGQIETSGDVVYSAGISIDASAPDGVAGSWLLDPYDLNIVGSATTATYASGTWTSNSGGSDVFAGDLVTILNSGASVVLQTSGTLGDGQGNGDITVTTPITLAGTRGASLTLKAQGNIIVNAAISSLHAPLNVTLDANTLGGGGYVNVAAGITTNGGALVIGGGANPLTGSAVGTAAVPFGVVISAPISAGGGAISITGTGFNSSGSNYGIYQASGQISTTGTGTITLNSTSYGSGMPSGIWLISNGVTAVNGLISVTAVNKSTSANFGQDGLNLTLANSIVSTGSGGISLTGTAGGTGTGGNDYGVTWSANSIAWGNGPITITGTGGDAGGTGILNNGVYVATALAGNGAAISITGTGGNASSANYGIFQIGAISNTGTGAITLNSTTNGGGNIPSGIALNPNGVTAVNGLISVTAVNKSTGTVGGQDGLNLTSANTIVSTGSGGITLNGTAGGAGTSGSNFGVTWSGSSIVWGNGPITITGTGGGGGSSNYGVYVQTALAGNGAAISITGTGGNSAGVNYGIYQNGGAISNTGTGTITLNSTTIASAAPQGIVLQSNGVTAVDGLISVTAVNKSAAAAIGQNGIYFNGQSNVLTSTGAGGISLNGTAGGTGVPGSDVGVQLTLGSIVFGSGPITITGTGGDAGGTGNQNFGVWIPNALTLNGGAISITGTGGNSSGSSNHGIYQTASITNTGAGSITLNGTGGGTGAGEVGVYSNNGITAGTGNILVTGAASATGTGSGNHGIYLTNTVPYSTGGAGSITMTGTATGTGTGTGTSAGFLDNATPIRTVDGSISITGINNSTSAVPFGSGDVGVLFQGAGTASSSGLGGITVNGTGGGSGAGQGNYGVSFQINNALRASGGGAISITGKGGDAGGTGGNNYGVYLALSLAGSGGAINITGTGGNSSGSNNYGINQTALLSNTNAGSITLNGTGGGSGSSAMGYFTSANVTGSGGTISITGAASATAAADATEFGIDVSAGILSNTGTGILTLVSTTTGSGATAGIALAANAVTAVDGLISVTAINKGTGAATGQDGINFANANSIVSTGVGGVSLTGTGGGTGASASDYGVILGGGSVVFGSGPITITGTGGDAGGTGANNYGVSISQALTGSGSAISITGTGGNSSGSGNLGILQNGGTISNIAAGTITLNSTAYGSNTTGIVLASNGVIGANGLISITAINKSTSASSGQDGINFTGANTVVSNGTGGISLNGTAGGTGAGGSDYGVNWTAGSVVFGSGPLTIAGTGGDAGGTGANNYGVNVAAALAGGGGAISITGTGGNSSGIYNAGIALAANTSNTGTGSITLSGTAGGSGDQERGFVNTGTVTAQSGNISITGKGGLAATTLGDGVDIEAPISTGGAGTITISGTATGQGASATNSSGVWIAANVSAVNGLISITGTNISTATGGFNAGVEFEGAVVSINGLGSILVNGTGGGAGASSGNYGVDWGVLDGDRTANVVLSASGGPVNISITGTGGDAGGTGANNYGVYGATALAGNGAALSITGTGGNASGAGNTGIYLTAPISNIATGTITLVSTTFGGGSGYAQGIVLPANGVSASNGLISVTAINKSTSTASGLYGINLTGANTIVSNGTGGITLNGTAGGTGAGGSDYGVTWSAGSIAFGSGPITIIGTGGDAGGTGFNNYGVNVAAALAGSGGAISITGTGGNSSGGSNYGIGQYATISNTGAGSITLNGTGGGSSGGESGYYQSSGNVTAGTGNIAITGTASTASTWGYGYYQATAPGGTISTAGSGTITINGTGYGSAGFVAGVYSTGAITAVDGLISLTGTNNAIDTLGDDDGVFVSGVITSSGLGGIKLTGFGGGTGNGGNDYGVYWTSATALRATGGGAITITGTGGDAGGSGTNNYGVSVSGLTGNGGAIAITGTGGNSTGATNYGISEVAGISNIGTGTITLSSTTKGSSTTSGISLVTNGVTAVNGLISVTAVNQSTSASLGQNGIYLTAPNSIVSTGSGGVTLNGTGGGKGAVGSDYGVTWISNAISFGNGPLTIIGTGGNVGGTGGNNYGVAINAPLAGSGSAISITGTGGNSLGPNNNGIAQFAAISNTGTGSITLNGTGVGTSSSQIGYYAAASVTAGTGNISITGVASAVATGTYNIGIDVASGTISTAGAGTITLSSTSTGVGLSSGIALGSNAVTAVNGLISVTAINNSPSTAGAQDGIYLTAANSIVSTGTGGISLNGTAGGTGTGGSNFGVTWSSGAIAFGSGPITITGTGGDTGGTGSSNYGVYIQQALAGGGGAITITGTSGASSGASNIGIDVAAAISNSGAGNISLTGTGSGGGASQAGVFISGGAVTAATGNIAITGYTSAAALSGNGVYAANLISTGGAGTITINGTSTGSSSGAAAVALSGGVSAVDGLISITGVNNATASGTGMHGVNISAGNIATTGLGGIFISGTGGGTGAGGSDYGVNLVGTLQAAGAITIIGTGGDAGGTGNTNDGVVAGTITGGAISITGTGGNSSGNNNYGVLESSHTISNTGAGSIILNGTGGGSGNGESGVVAGATAAITSNGGTIAITGNLSTTGNSGYNAMTLPTINAGSGSITLTSNGPAVSLGGLIAATLDLEGASGVFTLNNSSNAVGTLTGHAGSVNYAQASALTVAGLTTSGNTAISVTGTGGLNFSGPSSAGGALTASTVNGNITLNSGATLSAAGSGDALVLQAGVTTLQPSTTGGDFVNNAGAMALATPNGNWLVYSGDKVGAGAVDGGLTNYTAQGLTDATYTPASGANYLFSRAPLTIAVTASLTGTVIKTYDGTLLAMLNASNYLLSGVLAADQGSVILTVNGVAITSATSGLFSFKDVGNNLLVTVTGLGLNQPGSAYALTATTISSNIGTINPALLTLSAANDTKVYDGTTASSAAPTIGGLASGDSVSGLVQAYASRNVLGGGASTLNVTAYALNDGNGGADYTVQLNAASGTIIPATLVIAAQTDTKGYDGTTASSRAPQAVTYMPGGDSVTGLTQAFASKDVLGASRSTLQVTGYTVNDGNHGANYAVQLSPTTGTINPAPLIITAQVDNRTYDGTVTSSIRPRVVSGLYSADSVTGLTQVFTAKDVMGIGRSTLVLSGYTINDGNHGADYFVVAQSSSGTISPATLVIAAQSDTKTYDGTITSSVTPQVITYMPGSDSVTGLTQAFISKDVLGAAGSTLQVTGYTLNDGNHGANYAVQLSPTTGTINPATLTITAASDTKVYDGTTASSATPTYTGLVANDAGNLTGLVQAFASKDVLGANGSAINVTGYSLSDASNYTVATVSALGSINPALLTITAANGNKVYDGTVASSATPTVGTLYSTDSVTGLTQAYASRNVLGANGSTLNVTGYTVNDGNGGADYTVSLAGATGTITPATLTITAANDNKVYDGTASSSVTPTVGTLFSTDTVTGLTQAYASRNVLGANGSILNVTGYTVNDGNGGADYTVSLASSAGTITPAALTISAASDTKIYDGTTASGTTPTYTGLVANDAGNLTGLVQAFASKDVLGSNGSTLNVTGYALSDAANYAVTTVAALGSINPALLTITAANDNKVYDGTVASSATPTTGTLYSNDSVTGLTQAYASRNVLGAGGSTLNVTGYSVNDGNGGADYTVSLASASGSITKAALHIQPVSDSKVYDGTAVSNLTPTYSGLVTADAGNLTGLTQAFGGANVAIAQMHVTSYSLTDPGNYTVSLGTAVGQITPATLTLSAVTDIKVYDGTTASSATPTYSGLVAADAGNLTGLTQAFASQNVLGTGASTLFVTSYSLSDANNYSVSLVSAPGTINPATLTLSAVSDTRTYDGTSASGATPTYSGLVAADAGNLTGLVQSFASKDVLGANGSTINVTGYSLSDAYNYTVATVSALGSINPALLTITAANDNKVYDGTLASSATPTYTGLVAADAGNLTGLVQAFASKDVLGANGSTLNVTGYSLSDAYNYTVAMVSALGSITPASLTITAANDNKVYDGTVASSATPTTGTLYSTDTVTGLAQAYASRNVLGANGSTLNVTGYTVNDGNGGADYTVSLASSAGTITPASLQIQAVSDIKVYDGTNVSTATPTYSGLVANDAGNLTGLVQSFASKDVLGANGSTINVTGYSLSDAYNYTVVTVSALGSINPAALTLSAVSDTKTYDGTTASNATPTYTGLVAADAGNLTGLVQSFSSKDVLGANGSTINVTGYSLSDAYNYTVATVSALGSINPASLTLTAANDNKVYDGTTASSATPTTSTLYSIDTVSGLAQAYASRNVLGANGSTLNVTGYTVNDGNGGADYTVSLASSAGTITPASLTIQAVSDVKVYDGTSASIATPTYTGLVAADAGNLTGLTQVFAGRNVGIGQMQVTGFSLTDPGNYTVSLGTAVGQITPATLTISAANDTKIYDGTTASSATPTYSGLVAADAGNLTGMVQGFASKDVAGANGSTLNVNGYSLSDAYNYSVVTTGALGTINPALLTITAANDNKVYDGTTSSSATPTTSTLYSTDTVSGLTQAYASQNVQGANGSTLNVTGYTVNDGNGGADYAVSLASSAGTITPASLNIQAVSDVKVYDGTAASSATPTYTGLVAADAGNLTGLTQAFAGRNVGIGQMQVTGYSLTDPGNYTVSLGTAVGQITPATLTISAVSDTKTYDGTIASSATPTYSGLVATDTGNLTGLVQSFASKDVLGANGSTINVTGYSLSDAYNYAVATVSALGTINPASLTLTAANDNKVYDGATTSSATPTVGTLYSTDTVSGLAQAYASRNVLGANGSMLKVTAYSVNDGNGGADYAVTLATAPGTITPASLTISAASQSKTYDGTTASSATPTSSALVAAGGDTINGLSQAFASKDVKGANGSTLNVTGYAVHDGNSGANYAVTLVSALGTINPAALGISATSQSKVYDGTTTAAATPTTSGLITVGGDTVTGLTETYALKDVKGTNGSTLNVTAYTINDGNGGHDYAVTLHSATGTITAATLTYDASSVSKTYGSANPTLTGALDGLGVGDTQASVTTGTLTFTTSATSSSNAGSYAVNGSGLTVHSANYVAAIGQDAGNATALTINPATLTYTANSAAKIYGASNPSLSGAVSGYVLGQNQSSATTGSLSFTTSATTASNVGSYAINGSGLTARNGNYVFVQAAANATALKINPATLTYTAAAASRTYGAADASYAGTVTGYVLGQNQTSATTGTLSFTTTAVAASNVGNYAINGSGLTANNGNYVFTQASANATALKINPATLTYVANDVDRTYGSANPALTGTVTGFVLGQTQASATNGTAVFTTSASTASNVGDYAINGSGLTAKTSNYVFAQAAGNATALSINPATLTYVANSADRDYGDSNPALTGTVTGFVLGQNQNSATTGSLKFTTTATATSNVGDYAVNGSGLTAKNGNYVFAQAAGNATALSIDPATLYYAADIVIRQYNTNNPALPGSVVGFVLGQTQATATTGTLSFTTTATKTSPLGFYAITGAGLTVNNGNYVLVQAPWNSIALIVSPFAFTLTFDVTKGDIVGFDLNNNHNDNLGLLSLLWLL